MRFTRSHEQLPKPQDSGAAQPRNPAKFLLLRGLAILILMGSPWVIYHLISDIFEWNDMPNWPTTEGTVTHHSVSENSTSSEKPFRCYIYFTYEVGSQTYKKDRARAGSTDCTKEEADKLIAKYPRESKHPVYYAPSKPWKGYLEITPNESAIWLDGFFSVMMPVLGLALLGWSFPAPQNPNSPGAKWSDCGTKLLYFFVCGLTIGGATTKIFFSDQMGKGIPPGMYFILIPLWTMGFVGVLLWSAGRVRG